MLILNDILFTSNVTTSPKFRGTSREFRDTLVCRGTPFENHCIIICVQEGPVLLQSNRCGGWSSEAITVCPELPQGSPLSSVLFSVHKGDNLLLVNNLMGKNGHCHLPMTFLCFDMEKNRNEITHTTESEELDCNTSWCNVSKALVNTTKATFAWFSMNNNNAEIFQL